MKLLYSVLHSSIIIRIASSHFNFSIANNELVAPNNLQCACPESLLNFACTIVGGGNTLWRGSAFNCPSTSNEIVLRHSQFGGRNGTFRSCNNGAIAGRSIDVENNCFTSQLNVTVSTSVNNRTVQCDHDSNDETQITLIGKEIINVISGKTKN